MHLNKGRALARPYESGYSIFRRFLISNPTLTKTLINKHRIQSNLSLNSYIRKILRLNNPQNNQTLDNYNTYHDPYITPTNHCASCAQQGYHSELFHFPWITKCPIHHIPLTSTCPLCKQPWPSCSDMITNSCTGCGRNIDYRKLPPLKYYNDTSIYKPLIKLFNFIYYDKENNVNLESSYVNLFNNHSAISPYNHNFPSLQICRSPDFTRKTLRDMSVTSLTKVFKKEFRIYEVDKVECKYTHKSKIPSWISKERNNALLLIAKCIKSATAKNHRLEILDFALLEKRELEEMMPLCPYCLALSLWFYRITGTGYDYRITRRNPFATLIEEYSNYSLFRPFPSDYFVKNGSYFKTSLNFQKWLYQRDLQATFINIFNESMKILNMIVSEKDAITNKSEESIIEPDEIYLDKTLYSSYNKEKMKVYVYYQSKNLLDETTLPKIHGASTHCKKLKQKLKITYLKSELKHDGDTPSFPTGLNYQEYLVLEYGNQSAYPHIRTSHFLPSNSYDKLIKIFNNE